MSEVLKRFTELLGWQRTPPVTIEINGIPITIKSRGVQKIPGNSPSGIEQFGISKGDRN